MIPLHTDQKGQKEKGQQYQVCEEVQTLTLLDIAGGSLTVSTKTEYVHTL